MVEPGFRLSARDVRKSFAGVEVLHGVALDVAGGEVVALLGENGAGKSTLVKIVAGDYQADAGEIRIDGRRVDRLTPAAARQAGIRMIFQELADAPPLTVAENIALGAWPTRCGLVRWREIRARARAVLEQLDVDLDVGAAVADLSIGERQIVEIARALTGDVRCLILDEPTAALSASETERLFGFVRRLRERGVALVYITHRLDEVRELADRVTVLRDGDVVLDAPTAGLTRRDYVSAMIGRELADVRRPGPGAASAQGPPVLRLAGATLAGAFADVNLTVAPGEVRVLYGKIGSGTAEVARTVFGLHRLTAGRVELAGVGAPPGRPDEAIAAGVGFLPADRKRDGAFLVRSVAENLCAPSWGRLARGGFIDARVEARAYQRWHDELGVRSRNEPAQLLETLSGGNQQKVMLGRWLERGSRLLVLVEPTRGVDVGAREEIYRLIRGLAVAEGVAVLIATSDYEEVVQVADTVSVMARGGVVAELRDDEITTHRLVEEVGG
jgi:ribose transport system ATP-binding protein